MKATKMFLLVFLGSLIFSYCGKPNPAEVINRCSGGYQIHKIMETPGYSQDLDIHNNFCYMTQGEGGLLILDITDPGNPETVTILNDGVRGYSVKIIVRDTVAYIAAGSYGVTVVNVSNPLEPQVTVSNLSMKPAKNIFIHGDYLFTSISEQGVKFADISYATQPDIRGGANTYGYAQSVSISSDGSLMFVACGEMGLSIFDISDFQNGFGTYPLLAWKDTEGYAEFIEINEEKSLAFLACGTAGLQIIDYSDMDDLKLVGSFMGGGYAKELVYRDNKVYMTAEERGLQVIDVTDISNPELSGSVDSEYALGIDIDGDFIYIADEEEGLIIVSIPE